jgi:hypothetical protein
MRTLFTRGFELGAFRPVPVPVSSAFSLGQASTYDGNQVLAQITSGESKMAAINAWIQARPSYLQILGADANTFATTYGDEQNWYATALALKSQIQGTTGQIQISGEDWGNLQTWLAEVNVLYSLTQKHPETSPKGASVTPAAAPPAAGAGPDPLLVGGAAVGVVAILALVLRK